MFVCSSETLFILAGQGRSVMVLINGEGKSETDPVRQQLGKDPGSGDDKVRGQGRSS